MSDAIEMPLFRVSSDEKTRIRAMHNIHDDDSMARDVDMVIEWYDKQQHLPQVPLDRDFVERLIISRKGSVEQAKQRIERIFTMRTLVPELSSRDIMHPDIQKQFSAMHYAVLPRLNHDWTRVHLFKFIGEADIYNLADCMKIIFMMIEYRLKFDYYLGDRYVFDFGTMSLTHVTKLNPVVFKNGDALLHSYGSRIFGFHYINAPSFMGTVLNIVKGAMSKKMNERMVVHPNMDDFYKVVNKSIMPKEYGGQEKHSLKEFADRWRQELARDEIRQYLLQQEKLKSNEALRVGPRPSDDMLGIPGSFKRIQVD